MRVQIISLRFSFGELAEVHSLEFNSVSWLKFGEREVKRVYYVVLHSSFIKLMIQWRLGTNQPYANSFNRIKAM